MMADTPFHPEFVMYIISEDGMLMSNLSGNKT